MRILAGKLKGRKLANCKTKFIRPAMALVRKSIFDTLQNFVDEANVLDLCAGTGVLGIEAYSRGAKKITFVDSDKNSIRLIKKNLLLCNIDGKVISGMLPQILKRSFLKNERFDLVFLDPPYGNCTFIEDVLEILLSKSLLSKNGLISIETETKSNFVIPNGLQLYKEKKYGNTKVTMLKSL